jgi:transposase
MSVMPKAFLVEFGNDVVAVVRNGEASIAQVARTSVSRSRVCNGGASSQTPRTACARAHQDESEQLRVEKRNCLLEQEAEVMRRASAYLSRDIKPKRCTRWSVN